MSTWESKDPELLAMLTTALLNSEFSALELHQLRADRRNDDPVDVLGDIWWDVVDGPPVHNHRRKNH